MKKKNDKNKMRDKNSPNKIKLGATSLDVFRQMRISIRKVTDNALKKYCRKMGWLEEPFKISNYLNGSFAPLSNHNYFKLCTDYAWFNDILDMIKENNGYITFTNLKKLARGSNFVKKQSSDQVVKVEQAFLLFYWIWMTEQQTNLNLVIHARNKKKTSSFISRIPKNSQNKYKWKYNQQDWVQYFNSKSPELRKRLLDNYVSLVQNVAIRMSMGFPRHVEILDLVSMGTIGLIEAFNKFNPSWGVKFETYAVPRIRGAILDELRALDWVPRSTRKISRALDKACSSLENVHGRQPTKVELANHLNISIEKLYLALDDVAGTQMLSLDEVIYRENDNKQVPRIETIIDNNLSPLMIFENKEFYFNLIKFIKCLSCQEQTVLRLYYFVELSFMQISKIIKLSNTRVLQIHNKALYILKGYLKTGRRPINIPNYINHTLLYKD